MGRSAEGGKNLNLCSRTGKVVREPVTKASMDGKDLAMEGEEMVFINDAKRGNSRYMHYLMPTVPHKLTTRLYRTIPYPHRWVAHEQQDRKEVEGK